MYQEVCFNQGTEAGGGVNVGHSLSPPKSFYACYGPDSIARPSKIVTKVRLHFRRSHISQTAAGN